MVSSGPYPFRAFSPLCVMQSAGLPSGPSPGKVLLLGGGGSPLLIACSYRGRRWPLMCLCVCVCPVVVFVFVFVFARGAAGVGFELLAEADVEFGEGLATGSQSIVWRACLRGGKEVALKVGLRCTTRLCCEHDVL